MALRYPLIELNTTSGDAECQKLTDRLTQLGIPFKAQDLFQATGLTERGPIIALDECIIAGPIAAQKRAISDVLELSVMS